MKFGLQGKKNTEAFFSCPFYAEITPVLPISGQKFPRHLEF